MGNRTEGGATEVFALSGNHVIYIESLLQRPSSGFKNSPSVNSLMFISMAGFRY